MPKRRSLAILPSRLLYIFGLTPTCEEQHHCHGFVEMLMYQEFLHITNPSADEMRLCFLVAEGWYLAESKCSWIVSEWDIVRVHNSSLEYRHCLFKTPFSQVIHCLSAMTGRPDIQGPEMHFHCLISSSTISGWISNSSRSQWNTSEDKLYSISTSNIKSASITAPISHISLLQI